MSFPPSDSATTVALALVHQGWEHLRLQRPLAAWASWQRALRVKADDQAAAQALQALAEAEELPQAARAVYRLRSPSEDDRRSRWNQQFQSRDMEDLDLAAQVFEHLADSDPEDADALWNQALCLAWSGQNAEALGALIRFVDQMAPHDFEAAVSAFALAEILRQGAGAEALAAAWSHRFVLDWESDERDPVAWLSTFAELRERPTPKDPVLGQTFGVDLRVFEWLDQPLPDPSEGLTAKEVPRVLAVVFVRTGEIQFSSPDRSGLQAVERAVQQAGLELFHTIDRRSTPLPIAMMDAALGTFRLPEGLDDSKRQRLLRELVEDYFENQWPRELVARQLLEPHGEPDSIRKAQLEGIVRVREQLANRPTASSLYAGYPFDRLRRRVGLEPLDSSTVDPADVTCMSRSELERLDLATLDTPTLIDAFRSTRNLWLCFENRRHEAVDLAAALRQMANGVLGHAEAQTPNLQNELHESLDALAGDDRLDLS